MVAGIIEDFIRERLVRTTAPVARLPFDGFPDALAYQRAVEPWMKKNSRLYRIIEVRVVRYGAFVNGKWRSDGGEFLVYGRKHD